MEVNEEEIAKYLPGVARKLSWLSGEDLLKRVVSLEFNRLLNYYKDAPDIDFIDEKPAKKERKERQPVSDKDKDREPGTFMIQACRCRRCGGLLTSKEGVRNGIGHVCRMKALREMPDPNQVTVFDVLNDKEENTHEK